MSRVHVIAIITAKPGKRAEVLENFNANVAAVHAENGCIEYGAVIDCVCVSIHEDVFPVLLQSRHHLEFP